MLSTKICLFLIILLLQLINSQSTESSLEQKTNSLIKQQKTQEALNLLDDYFSKNQPSETNYLLLYKRAIILHSLNRNPLNDLNKVLEIRNFESAFCLKLRVLLLDCELEEIEKEIKEFKIEKESDDFIEIQKQLKDAKELISRDQNLDSLNSLINICSNNPQLRIKRAKLNKENKLLAINDLTRAFQKTNNLDLIYEIIELQITTKSRDLMFDQLFINCKSCLHNDPENKFCSKVFKGLKKIKKLFEDCEVKREKGKFRDIIKQLDDNKGVLDKLKIATTGWLIGTFYGLYCESYIKLKKYSEGMDFCSKAIETNELEDYYLFRGDAYTQQQDYEKALQDYNKVLSLNNQNQKAKEGIHKVQKLQKLAKKKDYYKILGVDRNADDGTIKRAFRKLAKEYHPDKYRGDEKVAQEKMSEINMAYEVLSNKELRERYDNGDDPNDPESQQQGFHQGGFPFGQPVFFQSGGNPFGQGGFGGGNPFGNGHFEFRFG